MSNMSESGQKSAPSAVYDPSAIVDGKTIAKWTENWWQWAVNAKSGTGPMDSGPIQSYNNGKGSVLFLADTHDATVHAFSGQPILVPMLAVFDTEGPGIPSSDQGWLENHPGATYSDEAKHVVCLYQNSIEDAYAKLVDSSGRTVFNINWPRSSHYVEKTGTFALGEPDVHSWMQELLKSVGAWPLDNSVKNLPNTAASGDWLMIKGLKQGTYTLKIGGSGGVVIDHQNNNTQISGPWSFSATDKLVVGIHQ